MCLFFSSTQSQVSSRSQSQPVCQFFALNMAALPTGKHFDLTESQKELLKKLQEALVCCDPLTQGTCSWSKFASNVRWPTLSFSCQKQEFRKWLITNFANGSHSFTTEFRRQRRGSMILYKGSCCRNIMIWTRSICNFNSCRFEKA